MEIKFSKHLRALRQEEGLTQAAVATHLKVTAATVTRWETNTQEPDYHTLVMLARFFGVTTDYLLGNDTSEYTLKKRS